jgi:hypothetical protein
MAVPNFHKNVEIGTIYVPLWHTGLYTQRSPLYTPISSMGMQIISRYDTLWAGVNMELSLSNTLVRRPGFPVFCSQNVGAQFPMAFYAFKDLSGNIYPIVDFQDNICSFTPTALTEITGKSEGAGQTSFQTVGNTLYMVDGVDSLQWLDGAAVIPIGIAVPLTVPVVTTGTGSLLPTAGWSYGYSWGNSNTGAVSTMSPATATTGNLDEKVITETSVSVQVASCVVSGNAAAPFAPGTVTFGTPTGNTFVAGDLVTLSGLPTAFMNTTYIVESSDDAQFTTSSGPWGSPTTSTNGWCTALNLSGLTQVTATKSPITIPGTVESYVYTVVNSGAQFLAANLFGGTQPASVLGGNVTPSTSLTGNMVSLDNGSAFSSNIAENSLNKVDVFVNKQWQIGSSVAISSMGGGGEGDSVTFSWLDGQTVIVESCTPIVHTMITGSPSSYSGYLLTFTDPTGYGTIHGEQVGIDVTGTFVGDSAATRS